MNAKLRRSDDLRTVAEVRSSSIKTLRFIKAYHEAGHLLGYLVADYLVPEDGGIGIVGDRFRFRRRGTLGGFKHHPMSDSAYAFQILTALEGENVGNLDVRGRAWPLMPRSPLDTDFDKLEDLRVRLGEEVFEQCCIKAWKVVLENLLFLRAVAHQLFQRRYLDAGAIYELEKRYPPKDDAWFTNTEAPKDVPAGLLPNPIELGW
jgi:hypothetical protein